MTDTRERFLREITERVPADRIAELHLFRPMRRGATETGIAVIAAELHDEPRAREAPGVELVVAPADDSPYAPEDDASAEPPVPATYPDRHTDDALEEPPAPATHPDRHTVFTARYRLTIKGADRGKWEFDVVADADAPLTTVDTVVRGVQRRAGDEEEPERLTSDGVRAALDGLSWRTTT